MTTIRKAPDFWCDPVLLAEAREEVWQSKVLVYCKTKDVANEHEQLWITRLGTMGTRGYNMHRAPLTVRARAEEGAELLRHIQNKRGTGKVMYGGKVRDIVKGKWQGPWRIE